VIRLHPPAHQQPHGCCDSMGPAERARLRTAALKARRLYPGGIGRLAARELTALAALGCRFDTDALIPRLAAYILDVEPAEPPLY
jgi:hypothetical protein